MFTVASSPSQWDFIFRLMRVAAVQEEGREIVWEAISHLIESNGVDECSFHPARQMVLCFLTEYAIYKFCLSKLLNFCAHRDFTPLYPEISKKTVVELKDSSVKARKTHLSLTLLTRLCLMSLAGVMEPFGEEFSSALSVKSCSQSKHHFLFPLPPPLADASEFSTRNQNEKGQLVLNIRKVKLQKFDDTLNCWFETVELLCVQSQPEASCPVHAMICLRVSPDMSIKSNTIIYLFIFIDCITSWLHSLPATAVMESSNGYANALPAIVSSVHGHSNECPAQNNNAI